MIAFDTRLAFVSAGSTGAIVVGGTLIVTADHGNADCMIAPDGQPHTAHTTNPVPFIICGADVKLKSGRLADIAPTMLDLMGVAKPAKMSGESLIVK